MSDDEYGTDIDLTEELQNVLLAVESQRPADDKAEAPPEQLSVSEVEVMDIEDIVQPSPFEEFKNGYLSVTDLVGTVWCEVQVSYCASRAVQTKRERERELTRSVRLVSPSLNQDNSTDVELMLNRLAV